MPRTYTYAHLPALARPNRAYLQAFIVLRDLRDAAIDAYADRLADRHHTPDAATLYLLCVAMIAHLDGWVAGYERGYNAAIEESSPLT